MASPRLPESKTTRKFLQEWLKLNIAGFKTFFLCVFCLHKICQSMLFKFVEFFHCNKLNAVFSNNLNIEYLFELILYLC